MDEFEISYALAKQVPDMHSRGFIIGTSYGEINVPPGPLAEQLADTVRLVLALELARLRTLPKVKVTPVKHEFPDYFDRTLMGAGQ